MNIVDSGSNTGRSMLEETDADEQPHIWQPDENCTRVPSKSLIIEDSRYLEV